MSFVFEERSADSPYIATVWRTWSGDVERFLSVAVSRWELVVMRQYGRTTVTVRGPETRVTEAVCPPEAEFFGIQFELGTVLSPLPPRAIVDKAVTIPSGAAGRISLGGHALEVPTFDDAETFVRRLKHFGLLERDAVVASVVEGVGPQCSRRTVERHFAWAAGLTSGTIRQIERARRASDLLAAGYSISTAVERAGFADQAHMTRALKRFTGQTPRGIQDAPAVRGL